MFCELPRLPLCFFCNACCNLDLLLIRLLNLLVQPFTHEEHQACRRHLGQPLMRTPQGGFLQMRTTLHCNPHR